MSDETFKGLPRRIHVGAFTFRISIVESEHASLDGNAAMTVFDEFRVYVDEKLPFQRSAEVVQHELSHCINWVYGIDDASTEEQFVTQHSKGQIELMLKNPRLHTWMNRVLRQMRKEAKSD